MHPALQESLRRFSVWQIRHVRELEIVVLSSVDVFMACLTDRNLLSVYHRSYAVEACGWPFVG